MFGVPIPLKPAPGFGFLGAGLAEFFYTFMLVFVVLNVAAAKKEANHWYGLAIGFVIVAGAYGAGAISGGCFNPAVAIVLYTAAELLGAGLAAGLFKVVRPEDFGGEAGGLP